MEQKLKISAEYTKRKYKKTKGKKKEQHQSFCWKLKLIEVNSTEKAML